MEWVIVYVAGAIITAVYLGYTDDRTGDEVGAWFCAALWPVVGIALVVLMAVTAPFWVGRHLRRIFG